MEHEYNPFSAGKTPRDSVLTSQFIRYIDRINTDAGSNDFSNSDELLAVFLRDQRKNAGDEISSESVIAVEVNYNKMGIFNNTKNIYLSGALVLLIMYFAQIFRNQPVESKQVKRN